MSEKVMAMRLEQVPKLKQAIELKLSDLLKMGKEPQNLRWKITTDHGAAELIITVGAEFNSMKHPSDDGVALSREQYKELVDGKVSVSGTCVLTNPHLEKIPLKENHSFVDEGPALPERD